MKVVVYQTVAELQVQHVVVELSAAGNHSFVHVSCDHNPAETGRKEELRGLVFTT